MARRKHKQARCRGTLVRNRHNTLVAMFYMNQSTADWRNWGYRMLSQAKAEELEREGRAERVIRSVEQDIFGEDGQVCGSQKVVMTVGWRMQEVMRSERPSPTTLTMSTSRAVSGEFLRGDRPTRGERALIAKFVSWPLIGDTKAVAVRPRITPGERRHAESLLGFHGADAVIQAEKHLVTRNSA